MLFALLIVIVLCVLNAHAIERAASRCRDWIGETHSRHFELCRHFFVRFFDSELVSDGSQVKVVAGGVVGILASLSLIFGQAYYHKYGVLSGLDSPEPFQKAVRGDVLFLTTLAMVAAALLTTLEWPALFPTLRDYLALASLPVRMREIFAAKFAALIAVGAGVITAVSLPPSALIPAMMTGTYAAGCVWHVPGIFIASVLGGFFVLFAFVAIQGMLLNLLPVRQFHRVSLAVQGFLLAVLFGGLPLVFSIPAFYNRAQALPAWSVYSPPFWFFGIDQVIFGVRDPAVEQLARIALIAVPTAAAAAIAAYLWSYRRHRVRVLESPSAESAAARAFWPATLSERLLCGPRSLGVFGFIAKALARSRQHRLILTAFAAVAVALISEGFASLAMDGKTASEPIGEAVIAIPLALSLFLLAGLRYLFRLPVDLRANWIFRITEPGHAPEFASGIDRFFFYWGAMPVAVLTSPIEILQLGIWTGILVTLICLLVSLVLIELLLFTFDRIPFTSSYLPGQRPLIEAVLKYSIAAVTYVWGLAALISISARSMASVLIFAGILAIAWQGLRRARLTLYPLLRFEFEERLEPIVQRLGIERE
jgi:hypothetical protein